MAVQYRFHDTISDYSHNLSGDWLGFGEQESEGEMNSEAVEGESGWSIGRSNLNSI